MSSFLLTRATAPATPPAGKIIIYAKADGRMYWKDETGTEYPFRPVGAGSGDLLADGSIPLTANWDVGPFQITALRFHSDEPTLSPFTVVSQALVTNLNADMVDGLHSADLTTLAMTDVSSAGWVVDEDNMVSNDDTKVPTQQSVKAYVDQKTQGANIYQTAYNASTNSPDLTTAPNAILKGQYWVVGTAGTFFGANVEVGDTLIAEQDSPAALANWTVLQTNLDAVSVKALYESNADTNAFSDAEQTKLTNIEALADVTDATNVAAAGAVMDGDFAAAEGMMRKTGAGTYAAIKTNLTAIVPPGVNDDSNAGYGVGSLWVDTVGLLVYTCIAPTVGTAVWKAGATFDGTKYVGVNDQTGTTYELVLADAGKLVTMNNAAANTLTIPANASVAFPVGTRIDVLQKGAGQTTVAITSDTLNKAVGLKINAQWEVVSLLKIASTTWVMVGGVA